jgi:hypothetical protein
MPSAHQNVEREEESPEVQDKAEAQHYEKAARETTYLK